MEQLQTNDTAEQASTRSLARFASSHSHPSTSQVLIARALAGRTYSLDRPARTVDHACMLSRFDMHSTHSVALAVFGG